MDMVVFDSNNAKRETFERFVVVIGRKLYLSQYASYANEVQEKAERVGLPFIWQRFSCLENLAPECVRDQRPKYKDSILGFKWEYFYEFDIEKVPYHWKLSAEKYIEENSQDVHSREYLNWITDRSVFYNNGFYDYAVRNDCAISDIKAIKACMGKTYEELYSVREYESSEYSFTEAYATAARFGNKYIIYGTGGAVSASDWMNFRVFRVYNSEAEMLKVLEGKQYSYERKESPGKASRFFEFIKEHGYEEKLIENII